MNDPMAILKKDHREVNTRLSALAKSNPGPERNQLMQEVDRMLRLHMDIEERVVYPSVERVEGKKPAKEANVEHGLVRAGLDQARQLRRAPGFGAAIEMLAAGVSHHVKEEESEILPALKQGMSKEDWESLGNEIEAAKAAKPARSQARRSTSAAAPTKPASRRTATKPAAKPTKPAAGRGTALKTSRSDTAVAK